MNGHRTSDRRAGMPLPGLELRALGPGDRELVASMFGRLSPQSRYRRFNAPKPELTPRELSYFTDVDHFHHVAIGAVDRRDGSIVGTARYVQEAGRPRVADVAVEVIDELQNRGIGTVLVATVVELARANGFGLLTATTQWENRPARAVLGRLRFRMRARHRGELELELALEHAPNTS